MKAKLGLFDVDNRELARDGSGLAYRSRVAPIIPKLEILYQLAQDRAYRVVLTTCCSARMPEEGSVSELLHVPLDSDNRSWQERVDCHNQYYLAKRSHGDPRKNFRCRAFDMFQDNRNATRLLQILAIQTWVVFGNGFDLCVYSAALGVLSAGFNVIVLTDVRVSSARGTPKTESRTLRHLQQRGARPMTLAEFVRITW